jgi:serine/threonine-protein kinase HipA
MAKRDISKEIYVYADWKELGGPVLMGVLRAGNVRGKEVFAFEYDRGWLKSDFVQVLDPELQLYTGPQYINDEAKSNFGIFMDSSPDRWGRVLMRRREAALAGMEGREERKLRESDYLLGVFDGHRMGAIRFKEYMAGPFLSDNKEMATPPWTALRELTEVSQKLEDENATQDKEYLKWLALLFAPGASLGGARPKASIVDPEGNLWIAKFPSRNDQRDIGAWEMVINDLAKEVGINMSEARLERYASKQHTYMTKRFDRTPDGKRIHFASAMTLLGYHDFEDGISYLELAEFIAKNSAKPDQDLEELWRRILFSIYVSNTDDHLRNHGFLLTKEGWRLSPAYDMNPIENSNGLKLNITEEDNALDTALAMQTIGFYRLTEKKAEEIHYLVKKVVSGWRAVANKYHISKADQDLMATSFKQQ